MKGCVWIFALAAPGCGARSVGLADAGEPEDAGCPSAWEIDRIDRLGWGGWASSLAIDPEGEPIVAYQVGQLAEAAGGIRIARDRGGAWEPGPVDTDAAAVFPALAFDLAGVPHVAYQAGGFGAGEGRVLHATEASGDWVSEVVEPETTGGFGTAIAIQPNGTVNTLHVEHTSPGGVLRHAAFASGAWTVEAVATWTETDWGSTLAVGPDGPLHAAWIEAGNLTLGRLGESDWETEIVSSLPREYGQGYQCVSLRLDEAGAEHLAFQALTGTVSAGYAVREAGGWNLETIDAGGDGVQKGFGISLAFGPDGDVHVSYTTSRASPGTGNELWYASRASGEWRPEPIDLSGQIGAPYGCESTSLAVDPQGVVHVAYFDSGSRDLLHAARTPGDACR